MKCHDKILETPSMNQESEKCSTKKGRKKVLYFICFLLVHTQSHYSRNIKKCKRQLEKIKRRETFSQPVGKTFAFSLKRGVKHDNALTSDMLILLYRLKKSMEKGKNQMLHYVHFTIFIFDSSPLSTVPTKTRDEMKTQNAHEPVFTTYYIHYTYQLLRYSKKIRWSRIRRKNK